MKRKRGIPFCAKLVPGDSAPVPNEEHMKTSALPFPVALVSWLDTWQDVDWVKIRQARSTQPYSCKSVGFVIHRDEKRIVLAPTMGDGACDRTVIPMGAVTAIEVLVKPEEEGDGEAKDRA